MSQTISKSNLGSKDIPAISIVLLKYFALFVFFLIFQNLPNQLWSIDRWNFIDFSTAKFEMAFVIYLLVVGLLYLAEDNAKKYILAAAAVVLSMLLYGLYFFTLFFAAYVFYQCVYWNINTKGKIGLFCIFSGVYTYFALEMVYGNAVFFWYMFIFQSFFVLRFLLFFYHSIQNNFKRESFLDYVLYIFCPAYFIVYPHIIILPKFDYFIKSYQFKRDDFLMSAKSGIKYFGLGMAYLFFCYFVLSFFQQQQVLLAGHLGHYFFLLNVLVQCLRIVLLICGYGNLLLGLIRGLGYDIKPPFKNPWRSKDIIDFFDRFFVYFKEIAFMIFYVPFAILTKSLKPGLRVFVSTVATIALAYTLYNYFSLGVDFCETYQNVIKGVDTILYTYGEELGMGAVGIGPLLIKAAFIAIAAALVGGIIGAQLIFNQKAALAAEESVFIRFFVKNPVIKLVQWIIMIFVIWILFIL